MLLFSVCCLLSLVSLHHVRNCLFRALADQLEGDMAEHSKHRQETVRFMVDHRDDFEPFVEDDVPFDRHSKHTCACTSCAVLGFLDLVLKVGRVASPIKLKTSRFATVSP